MAQFDVYRVRGGGLVVDCQSDLLSSLPTRLVVPLRPTAQGAGIGRLTPTLSVEGTNYLFAAPIARAIAVRDIEATVTSLKAEEYTIKAALDMLVSGF